MIPNSSIAAFSADISSGASTIPMNAPGDPFPLDRLFGHAKGHGLMPSFRLGIRSRIGSILKSRVRASRATREEGSDEGHVSSNRNPQRLQRGTGLTLILGNSAPPQLP